MALTVGQRTTLDGDVTQLQAIGAKAPAGVEEMLGYHIGRLARGYWICLLVDPLEPRDFELAGNTLRSGGKLGLPAITQREDDTRTRVHDDLMAKHKDAGYRALQAFGLNAITATGRGRIVKVVPVVRHMKHGSPAKQYPMGGGSLQWTLKEPGKSFYVAAFVNALGTAETPAFQARIDTAAPYEDRARLFRFLESAPR